MIASGPCLVAVLFVLAPVIAQGQSSRTEPTATRPTAVVSGRVTVSGEPRADVEVLALTGRPETRVLARTTTEESGAYRVAGLPAGRVLIATRTPTLVGPRDSFGRFPGRAVTLADGESLEGIDLALVPGGVITGRIVDEEGRPVIGLQIRAIADSGPGTSIWCSDRTDDRGIYRIFGLLEGPYKVSVAEAFATAPGSARRSYPVTYYPGTLDVSRATVVEVAPGSEARGIDFAVRWRGRGFNVAGKVVGSNGKPVPGVIVAAASSRELRDYSPVAPVASDGRGVFRLEGLSSGRYMLYAHGEASNLAATYADVVPIDVSGADVAGVEIRFRPGGRIQGRVVVEGQGTEESRVELSTLRVTCHHLGRPETEFGLMSGGPTAVQQDGSFDLQGVRPGRAFLSVFGPGSRAGLTTVRVERDGATIAEPLEVAEGDVITGMRLVVAVGSATVRGRLVVRGGSLPPNRHATVIASPVGRAAQGAVRLSTVGSDLRFEIDTLLEGEYELRVLTVRSVDGNNETTPLKGSKRVTVAAGQTVDVTVEVEVEEPAAAPGSAT